MRDVQGAEAHQEFETRRIFFQSQMIEFVSRIRESKREQFSLRKVISKKGWIIVVMF